MYVYYFQSSKECDEVISKQLWNIAIIFYRYDFLRQLAFPLPSYSTLCSRVSKLEMQPGVQLMIIDWMEAKMKNMATHNPRPSPVNKSVNMIPTTVIINGTNCSFP